MVLSLSDYGDLSHQIGEFFEHGALRAMVIYIDNTFAFKEFLSSRICRSHSIIVH